MDAPSRNGPPVALAIRIKVRPEAAAQFASWHAKATTAVAGLEGFVSAEVNAPKACGPPEWNIIQYFSGVAELRAWCATEQHRRSRTLDSALCH
jgi:antibiotic biosynthesis monooxygenase (ABM) superfamily enzyme